MSIHTALNTVISSNLQQTISSSKNAQKNPILSPVSVPLTAAKVLIAVELTTATISTTEQHNNSIKDYEKDLIEILPNSIYYNNQGNISFTFNGDHQNQVGWYCVCVKINDEPVSNSPFILATIKGKDFQSLPYCYANGKALFNCQVEKMKIQIIESYYFKNIQLYEFIINPTVKILLVGGSELVIQDNNSKVYLKGISMNQIFLILLKNFYFFGYTTQKEPKFESKIK
ncbi:hypothetical protein ACTFIU_009166 [Dictyostelium citrinum]